jgi:hypothetical protein
MLLVLKERSIVPKLQGANRKDSDPYAPTYLKYLLFAAGPASVLDGLFTSFANPCCHVNTLPDLSIFRIRALLRQVLAVAQTSYIRISPLLAPHTD